MPPEAPKTKEKLAESAKPTVLNDSVLEMMRGMFTHEEIAEMLKNCKTIAFKKKPETIQDYFLFTKKAAVVHMIRPDIFAKEFNTIFLPSLREVIPLADKEFSPDKSEKLVRSYDNFSSLPVRLQQSHIRSARLRGYSDRIKFFGMMIMFQTTVEGKGVFEQAIARDEQKIRNEIGNPAVLMEEQSIKQGERGKRDRLSSTASADRFLQKQEKYPQNHDFFARVKNENGRRVYETKGASGTKARWEIQEMIISTRDVVEKGTIETGLLFYCLNPEGASFVINPNEESNAEKKPDSFVRLDPAVLDKKAAEALATRKQETDPKSIKALVEYDLPKDKPMTHLRVYPATHSDDIVWSKVSDGAILSSALKLKHPAIDIQPPMVTNDPAADLETAIAAAQKRAKRKDIHVCIDVFSHGSREQLEFGKPFTQASLITLANKFPDCTFTFNTMGCFGGGMQQLLQNPEFSKNPDLQKRLSVFLQTKPYIENIGTADGFSPYYIYLTRGLLQGHTYGKAAHDADIECKSQNGIDAEAIIQGKLYTSIQPTIQKDILAA